MTSPVKSSLETRLTSTPIITHAYSPVELRRDFSNVSPICEEPTAEISNEEFSYSENYEQYFDDIKKKIRHGGKEWQEIKPKTSDRIYSSIIEAPKQTEYIVLEILHKFERAPQSATIHVLQFFVDVCGFQDIEVKNLYDFKNADAAPIFKQMENSNFLIRKHKIFDRQTELCGHVRNAVFNFIQKFVRLSWMDKFIFNDAFGIHILHFLQLAAMNEMCVVHATGLILSAKFLSEITFLYNKTQDSYLEHQQKILTYIEHLNVVIIKTWYRSLGSNYTPRVRIAREIYLWIKHCPDIFTSKYCCVKILHKLLRDGSFEVRKSALETCEKLLILEDLPPRYLNYILKHVVYDIHQRLLDVNNQVAIKSLSILSLIRIRYPTYLKEEYFKIILSYIFNPSLVLAKQAANFIINMLQDEQDSVCYVLVKLSNCVIPQFSKLMALLVESSFDHSNIIQSWGAYIELLKDRDLDIAAKTRISEMAYCAIYYTLTGKSLITRDPSVAVNVVREDCHKVAGQAFIPQMKILLSTFEASPKIMINLMNIIQLIKPTDNYSNHYEVIFNKLKEIFKSSNREEVLIKIVETFCEIHNNQDFKSRCNILVREFVEDFFDSNVENRPEFHKISILFSKLDLTSYLDWEDITQNWNVINENTKYVVASGKCFLKWKLKILNSKVIDNILDEKNCRIIKDDISSICKQFLKRCKELINEAHRLRNCNLAVVVIHEIFDLCSFYKIELSTLGIMHNFLNSLEIRLDNEFQSKMIDLACNLIFMNTTITILERRKIFAEIMDLIFFNTCGSTYLAKLLKYYHSHSEVFGELIEHGLVKLNKACENTNRVVLYTLCMEYKELIQSKAVWELQGLRSLASRFHSFKQLKYDINFCERGLYFAMSSKENVEFLRILRYFITALNPEEKNFIHQELRTLATSKGWEKNNTVLFFSNLLKEGSVIKRKKPIKGKNTVNKKKKITHVSENVSEASTDVSIHFTDSDNELP